MISSVRSERERGFTLIELVIIVAISLVMVALTGKGMMSAVDNYKVASAARQVMATVQVAHLKAPANNTRFRVTIDPTAGTWLLERCTSASPSAPCNATTGWSAEPGYVPIALPLNVRFSAAGITAIPPDQTDVTQAGDMTFNTMSMLVDMATGQPAAGGRCFYIQGNTDRPAAVCSNMVGRTAFYRLSGGVWELQ